MRISVIVPVRDDPRIDSLLASLASQHGAPPFEVLVALDGARHEPLVPPSLSEKHGVPIRYEPGWWVAHRHLTSRWEEGWRAFEQGKNGAFWAGKLDLDLFASVRGRAPKGPGTWLLSRSRSRPAALRAASLAFCPSPRSSPQ